MISRMVIILSLLFGFLVGYAAALNNGLALTPQMGWNSWNSFYCNISETVILEAAEKMVKLGFKDLGYEYVVVDDCWSAGRNSSGYLQPDLDKFPNGISGLADRIHSLGLKIGIYSSAGTMTCGRYEGSLGYETQDAEAWASWGIDYLKYDNCYNEGQEGTPLLSFNRYNAMGKALNKTGRPVLYSLCNWGVDGTWNWGPTIANSWRTTGDLFLNFDRDTPECPCAELDGLDCKLPGFRCSVMNVINKAVYYPSKAFPGAWNDLDMLVVGGGGLSDDEMVAHFSVWAALKSPLLMSLRLNEIDAKSVSILQNIAVVAVSQDAEGASATRKWRHFVNDTNEFGKGEISMFSGGLSGGDQVVLLLNAATSDRQMDASLVDIFWDNGPSGTAKQIQQTWDIYDLWANRMDDETANSIINGNTPEKLIAERNLTALGGAKNVFAKVPDSNSELLMGLKVGSVGPGGTVSAFVKAHGAAMFRLRQRGSHNEL
ncbi:hypothetical protein FQN53_001208 [Emmonsiellopsis sp. PD_33]|nr:hypothetical protein FQN53_001208 [Emmonsiellopsis sp. PD_33]